MSKKGDNKAGIRGENKARPRRWDKVGKKKDDKEGIKWYDKASIRKINKASKKKQEKVGTRVQDNKANKREWGNKKAAKQTVRVYHLVLQRPSRCTFLLAQCSNFFLAFSFLESAISWSLVLGSITNWSLSVTSINCDGLSLR